MSLDELLKQLGWRMIRDELTKTEIYQPNDRFSLIKKYIVMPYLNPGAYARDFTPANKSSIKSAFLGNGSYF